MGETMKRLAVVGWLLVAAGCSTVTVKEPFGEPASPDEREALLGVWLGEDGGSVEIRQTKEGALTAGMLVWDEEKEQFRAQTTNLTATEIDGNRFLLSEVIEGDRAGRFWFFRYDQPDEKTIRLFLPDVAAFKRVVESGELEGTATRSSIRGREYDDVSIDADDEAMRKFFRRAGVAKFFDAEPDTLTRIKKFK